MKKSISICFVAIVVLLFAACSKERKIERSLYKVGSWKIAELDYRIISQSIDPSLSPDSILIPNILAGSEFNAGGFVFDKKNKGNYAVTYNGITKTGIIRWEVNEMGSAVVFETTAFTNSIVNTALSLYNGTASIYQEMYSFRFEPTGKQTFTGDGTGVLQIMYGGASQLSQYAVQFDRIVLVPQ